jgi:hypothetical protein
VRRVEDRKAGAQDGLPEAHEVAQDADSLDLLADDVPDDTGRVQKVDLRVDEQQGRMLEGRVIGGSFPADE